MNQDDKKEYLGIVSIIVLIIVAALGVYYFYSHTSSKMVDNSAPLETPSPPEAPGTDMH